MDETADLSLSVTEAAAKWSGWLRDLGIALSPDVVARLAEFGEELWRRNEQVRLISCRSGEELFLSHLADSLAVLVDPAARADASLRCVDVGSGGGFPGVPVALARPAWRVTFVESVQKKAAFLDEMVRRFGLAAEVVDRRAEDAAREPELRDSHDLAFCRAVGDFSEVLELTLPFLKVGGTLLAHRGESGADDLAAAARALEILGGEAAGVHPYRLPHREKTRFIVRVTKQRSTPAAYPRRAGMPAQRPL
jgi:16S rRNA (guanine527-N7)-methyltransferase